jgi:hypothetical protein
MCDNFSHKVFTQLYFPPSSAIPEYDCRATEPVVTDKPLLISTYELVSMFFFLIHLLTTLVTNTYGTYVRTYFSRLIHFIACKPTAVTNNTAVLRFHFNNVMLLLNAWDEDFWLAKK